MAKPRIAIFIHHPECSVQCAHGIIRALSPAFDIDCFSKDQISDKFFTKHDIIAFPGSIGDSDSWHRICESTAPVIRNQIDKGKRYLGICMGAYWAGPLYFNLLDRINPVQYIKRPNAEIQRSYGTVASIDWAGNSENMFFYDGCAFDVSTANYTAWATYANGDIAALRQNNIGCIGPHPESDIYWYSKKFLTKHRHEYRHHDILLNFTKALLDA